MTPSKIDISATAYCIFKNRAVSKSLDSNLEDCSEVPGFKLDWQQAISNESIACAVVVVVNVRNDLKCAFSVNFQPKTVVLQHNSMS